MTCVFLVRRFRTPLNHVLGLTNLLLTTSLTHEQREYTDGIITAGKAQLNLIQEILTLTSIENGHVKLCLRDTCVCSVVDSVMQMYHRRARAKQLTLTYSIHEAVPAYVLCDAAIVKQVMMHLIKNAVDFTDAGRVTVHVSFRLRCVFRRCF